MERLIIRIVVLAGALLCLNGAAAQSVPNPPEAQLRFDQAKREEVADNPTIEQKITPAVPERAYAYKLNRKRVSEESAYNTVTLWNVRRVRINERRMRLSDTTGRERVRMLKFFTERNPKKGARPHLLGNVSGYNWASGYYDREEERFYRQPLHIGTYILRREYDSMRRVRPDLSFFKVPDELYHKLPYDAVYLLDGKPTPPAVFRIFDGLTLRTLDIFTDPRTKAHYGTDCGAVIGDTYPDRIPLVILNGKISTVDVWLKMCESNAFAMDAEIPMHYYFMQPVEAVQNYGKPGRFGAICINMAE